MERGVYMCICVCICANNVQILGFGGVGGWSWLSSAANNVEMRGWRGGKGSIYVYMCMYMCK